MNCYGIIKKHLSDNGFDGLVDPINECGCCKHDLAPRDCLTDNCRPAYRYRCEGNLECVYCEEDAWATNLKTYQCRGCGRKLKRAGAPKGKHNDVP